MKTFYFSKARAIELQDTAKTVKELDERFERSCSICPKAGYCDENKCFIAQTHNTKREVLKFRELIAAGKIKAPTTEIVHTRTYKKSERFDKGTIQRLLTIASKKAEFERQKLELDQASVFVEMNDYKNAYLILKKNGFLVEAETVKKYFRRKQKQNVTN